MIDLVHVLPDNSHAEHEQARRKKYRHDLRSESKLYLRMREFANDKTSYRVFTQAP